VTDVDFYADALISGRVLDIEAGAVVSQIEATLGRDFVDDINKKWMRRDYGLVEFHFNRSDLGWTAFGASLQVHRLSFDESYFVPGVLVDRYGTFRKSVRLDELVELLDKRISNFNLVRESVDDNFNSFRLDGIDSRIVAVRRQFNSEKAMTDFGDIWSIDLWVSSDREQVG
jgi:hypothetical protein